MYICIYVIDVHIYIFAGAVFSCIIICPKWCSRIRAIYLCELTNEQETDHLDHGYLDFRSEEFRRLGSTQNVTVNMICDINRLYLFIHIYIYIYIYICARVFLYEYYPLVIQHNYGKIHYFLAGKIHYFYYHFQ